MKNKIIVIEGTDCSGKETQSNMLMHKMIDNGYKVYKTQCPFYDSPTGKIIAGPYLGKEHYCESYFKQGASSVDPKVAGLYYAADRKYNISTVLENLRHSHVILDRYVDSNMAHQGGSITNKQARKKMYRFFEKLEYGLLELPRADIKVLLYMPVKYSKVLRLARKEALDGLEKDDKHLKHAELAYLEIAKRNHYKIISCVNNEQIRSIEDINEELCNYVFSKIKK